MRFLVFFMPCLLSISACQLKAPSRDCTIDTQCFKDEVCVIGSNKSGICILKSEFDATLSQANDMMTGGIDGSAGMMGATMAGSTAGMMGATMAGSTAGMMGATMAGSTAGMMGATMAGSTAGMMGATMGGTN